MKEDCDLSTGCLALDSNGHGSTEGMNSLSLEACKHGCLKPPWGSQRLRVCSTQSGTGSPHSPWPKLPL